MTITTKTQPLIIGVGELLWDLLPSGRQMGGAPANFAYHAQSLGAEALVVSRVGNDALGQEILDRLGNVGLRTEGITTDPSAPTGTVQVDLDRGGRPTFTIHENVAWDYIEVGHELLAAASQADAICFGSLAQRHPTSRGAIRALVAATPSTALRIFDVNLRQQYYSRELIAESLKLATVLKLNSEELPVVAKFFGLGGDETDQLCRLASCFDLRAVALTKGAKGSSLLVGGQLVSRPGTELSIVDTVGAGDSYTAAMAMGLLAGHDPRQIIEHAHRVADFVCTQAGAMPPLPLEIVADVAATTKPDL